MLTAVLVGIFALVSWKFPQHNFFAMCGAVAAAAIPAAIAYAIGERGIRQKATAMFMTSLSAGMMVKIMTGIAAILGVWFTLPDVRMEFLVAYFVAYFSFTALVVMVLMHLVRQQPLPQNISSAN